MTTPEQQPKQEIKPIPPAEEKPDVIPAQYKGMPSEVVEELWQNPVYIDAEKNKAEIERRQVAMEAIRKDEVTRETKKEKQINERFAKLPDNQKAEFPNAQRDAVQVLTEHVQGQRDVDGLSLEESFVLGKLKTAYEEFKRENPDKPFDSNFLQGIDRKVYDNLAQRLTFKVLEAKQIVSDQEKANTIRQDLGVPTQNVEIPNIIPKKETTPSTAEQIKSAFDAIGGGVEAGVIAKVQEYDKRIRAARAGKPTKSGDTEKGLLTDFKFFTKQEWNEGFDIKNFQKSRETQKRAKEIKPIDIIQTNENVGIEKRKIDPKNISFKQEGENIKVLYSGQEWYSVNGQFVEKNVGNKRIRIIISNDSSAPHASYESITDTYTIGPKAKKEFEKDPEMFLSSIGHEVAHDEYFSLDEKQQKETNNLFLEDAGLQDVLKKFATALYTDKLILGTETAGESYLRTHDVNNSATKQNTLAPEGQKGLKDARSIVFEVDGKKREILVGLLITELISYMSSLEISQDVFDKVAENGKNARGGKDPRYDAVQMCHDYIRNNPKISSRLEELKLLGRNTVTEQLFVNLLKNSPK